MAIKVLTFNKEIWNYLNSKTHPLKLLGFTITLYQSQLLIY